MENPFIRSSLASVDDLPAQAPYGEAIDSLIWLMISTQPNIGYAVRTFSHTYEMPLTSQWSAVKRVILYIKGTRTTGTTFGSE